MAITTVAGLRTAMLSAQNFYFVKGTTTPSSAGWASFWTVAGSPVAGVKQGSLAGAIPTNATSGAMPFVNRSGLQTYLAGVSIQGSVNASVLILDRVWHNSLMDATVAVDTVLGSGAIDRPDNTGNPPNELWMEPYTQTGTTSATLNVHYTDQDGNTDQVATLAYTTNNKAVSSISQLTLASADAGIRQLSSYWFSTSTLTAGDFGLTITRRIAEVPIYSNWYHMPTVMDAYDLGLPRIYDSSCLFLVAAIGGATGAISGRLTLVQG